MAKSWLQKYGTYEEEVVASAIGIVAFAGGGQANATQLLKKFNQVDTNASANDSVKLVPALIGKVQGVFNNTANDLTVYPAIGEYIDGTINNGLVIAAGDYVEFRAYAGGRWDSYAGAASGTGTVTSVSVVTANGFAGTVATANTTPAITITTTITGILVGNGTAISAAVAGDFPTLNQNTTGSAATLTTGRTIAMTGDVVYTSPSFNGSANVTATSTISNDAVTYAKIQNVTTNKLLGRATAGSGDVEEITLGTNLSFTGTTLNAASASVPTLAQVLAAGRDVDALGNIQDNLGFSAIEVNAHNLFGVWTTSASHATPILNLTGSTSGTISIKPKAIGGTWTLTLPDNYGSAANDLFVTDGSGITSWASLSSLLPLTTRGDIMVRGVSTNDRLALGASGTILRSNGTDLVYTTATYPATTTVNQLLYSSSANVIGGSANLTFDGTTFSTPIAAHSTSVTSPLLIGGSSTTQTLIYKTTTGVGAAGADHIWQIGTNGASEAMRILNENRLCIGTTSSLFNAYRVTIQAATAAGNIMALTQPTAAENVVLIMAVNGVGKGQFGVCGTTSPFIIGATPGDFGLRAAQNIVFSTTDGASVQMTLSTTTGRLGIGVSSPGSTLTLKAGTATANSGAFQILVGVSETTPRSGLMQFSSSSSSGIQAISGSRWTLTESDTTERYIVQAATNVKTTAGAPYANDGYCEFTVNGITRRFMTTAG